MAHAFEICKKKPDPSFHFMKIYTPKMKTEMTASPNYLLKMTQDGLFIIAGRKS